MQQQHDEVVLVSVRHADAQGQDQQVQNDSGAKRRREMAPRRKYQLPPGNIWCFPWSTTSSTAKIKQMVSLAFSLCMVLMLFLMPQCFEL